MTPRLAVIGSIVIDVLVETPYLPASGQDIHVPRVMAVPGGKAANAAVAFTRLGGEAYLLGNVGADFLGEQALRVLRAEGVNVDGVCVDPHAPTGAGVLMVEPSGTTTLMIAPGANQTLPAHELEARLRPLLSRVDGLLINFESPEATLLRAVELARQFAIPCFVDPGPIRPYGPALWRDAAVLLPNEAEAAALVGKDVEDDAGAIAAARELLRSGPRAVVLKRGERGALLVTADEERHFSAFAIEPVDTAGAGDAFGAGLVWSLLRGNSMAESIPFANACGAVAAGRFGTLSSMPALADVQALLSF